VLFQTKYLDESTNLSTLTSYSCRALAIFLGLGVEASKFESGVVKGDGELTHETHYDGRGNEDCQGISSLKQTYKFQDLYLNATPATAQTGSIS